MTHFKSMFRNSIFNAANPYKHTNMRQNLKDIGQDVAGHIKKNYNPKEGVFKKDPEGRNINNLWSGYTLGGKGKIAVTGSLLGGGTIVAANPSYYQSHYNNFNQTRGQSEINDIESLQSTRGDMQGYQAQIGNSALSYLQTSGDLVFAMHKTRHTGQM